MYSQDFFFLLLLQNKPLCVTCNNGCILFLVLHICTLVTPFVDVVCVYVVLVNPKLWGPNVPKNTVIAVIFNLVLYVIF